MITVRVSALLCVFFILSACGSNSGSGNSNDPTAPSSTESLTDVNFSGIFAGTETGTAGGSNFSQHTTLVLTQSGSTVTGTFDSGGGNTGTVYGTASGNQIGQFTATNSSTNPCGTGTFSGTATLNGSVLTATLSGTASHCGTTAATLSLTKQ